jgi:hypothetical protein
LLKIPEQKNHDGDERPGKSRMPPFGIARRRHQRDVDIRHASRTPASAKTVGLFFGETLVAERKLTGRATGATGFGDSLPNFGTWL